MHFRYTHKGLEVYTDYGLLLLPDIRGVKKVEEALLLLNSTFMMEKLNVLQFHEEESTELFSPFIVSTKFDSNTNSAIIAVGPSNDARCIGECCDFVCTI